MLEEYKFNMMTMSAEDHHHFFGLASDIGPVEEPAWLRPKPSAREPIVMQVKTTTKLIITYTDTQRKTSLVTYLSH